MWNVVVTLDLGVSRILPDGSIRRLRMATTQLLQIGLGLVEELGPSLIALKVISRKTNLSIRTGNVFEPGL